MDSNTAVRQAASVARGSVSSTSAFQAERDHELRSALFAIEVTATGLSRDRDRLASRQVDELLEGLVAEIHRVRGMVERRPAAPATFDLADAIAPAIACARGSGMDVRVSVPQGIQVVGCADSTAQVVVALLDNARRHAPSSPVELRIAFVGRAVALVVEDRGPGIEASMRGRVFERGARGTASSGSGLGLFVARRLMREQGGEISVRSRRGGGTMFLLQLRRPSPR